MTHFETGADFRAWLEEHHGTLDEIWVGYWKTATGRPSVTWEETVDVALCFGWIDGIRRKLDDQAYCIRFTPRRKRSSWSRRNLERYAVLEAAGRITAAGRAAYGRRTTASASRPAAPGVTHSTDRGDPKESAHPIDLSVEYVERIRAHPTAWMDWSARPPGYVRRVSHWIMSAKRKETRDRRLQKLIDDLEAGVA